MDTPTPASFKVGGPSVPGEALEETFQRAATDAGEGSIGGPEVLHLVSPSLSSEDSSCFKIPPPSTTPSMCVDLVSSKSDDDFGPEEYEVVSRARLLLRVLALFVECTLVFAHLRISDPLTVVTPFG
ncbi:hypothetical protein A2U01_0008985 [Trifolium medium]|uniref:Uncharacterized protein n=1 Tax=Trifolium medium TaxID=97028 RepID=A0A392MPA9_9FABA|nr:hypothetical protein [Trifolium medium]